MLLFCSSSFSLASSLSVSSLLSCWDLAGEGSVCWCCVSSVSGVGAFGCRMELGLLSWMKFFIISAEGGLWGIIIAGRLFA